MELYTSITIISFANSITSFDKILAVVCVCREQLENILQLQYFNMRQILTCHNDTHNYNAANVNTVLHIHNKVITND